MIDPKDYNNLFVDLMSPAQFKAGKTDVYRLFENIESFCKNIESFCKEDGAPALEQFFVSAGAEVVVNINPVNHGKLNNPKDYSDLFFALGVHLARDYGTGYRVFWLEINGIQGYWIAKPDNGAAILRRLACALYSIPSN